MRQISGWMTALFVGFGSFSPTFGLDAPPAGDAEQAGKVEAILAEWERRSADVTNVVW